MKRLFLLAAELALTLTAFAQPGGDDFRPGDFPRKECPTVEQEAQAKVDMMNNMLTLTEKQNKKLFKYYKKDIKYRRENFEFDGPRPGMMPGRPEGGFPERGEFPGGGPGMRPDGKFPGFIEEVDLEKFEKYNAKQDKKLRKIIGDENFEKWNAVHPREPMRLPVPDFGKYGDLRKRTAAIDYP